MKNEKKKDKLEKSEKIVKKDKKKNIIARHKLLFLICFLAFAVLVVLFYIFFSLFIGGNDPYGDRLRGINKVKISNKEQSSVTSFLKEKEEVSNASVHIKGKIIYIHIKTKAGVDLGKAKEIANESLSKFSDDEKKFYDFGYFLSEDKEDGYVVTGTKNANSDVLVWIKS